MSTSKKKHKNNYNGNTARTQTFKTKTNNQTKSQTNNQTIKAENSKPEEIKQSTNHQETANKLDNLKPSSTKKMRIGMAILIFFGSTLVVGVVATLLGGKLNEAYTKPPLYAPDWVFPVAWTILYIAIATAAFLANINIHDKKKKTCDGIWYGIHLFFNVLWPLFYFRLNLLVFSAVWLGITAITAIILTYKFYKSHIASGIIFTIYTLWLLYALYLNIAIAMLNVNVVV